MKIIGNVLDNAVYDLENKPLKLNNDKESPNLSIREALRRTCTSAIPKGPGSGEDMNEEDKYKLYDLAKRIMSAKGEAELELTTEEVVLIKNRAKKAWTIEASGFLSDLLEQKTVYSGEQTNS